MSLPRALAWNEKQTTMSRIWTWVIDSILDNDKMGFGYMQIYNYKKALAR